MDLKFECPRCGQHLAVEERAAGMTVKCPSCEEKIGIPGGAPPPLPSPPPPLPPPVFSFTTERPGATSTRKAMRQSIRATISKRLTVVLSEIAKGLA